MKIGRLRLFRGTRILMLLVLVGCGLTPVSVVQAQGVSKLQPWLLAEIDSKQAAKLVAKKTGGKVLSVNEEERKGVPGYRVKVLLPEGRIRKVFVEKQSGAISG